MPRSPSLRTSRPIQLASLLACLTLGFCKNEAQPPAPADDGDRSTPFELSDRKQTATYEQGIDFYRRLARSSDRVQMTQEGSTDSGLPLHLLLHSPDGDFDIASNRRKGRRVLLINNAIHPGEPAGVDASMLFLRELAEARELGPAADVLVAIIPFYNLGGVLNRGSYSRANQNGPLEYGFRGNARNFDLNRDFVKTDTLNMRAFARIFHRLDPDILVDTHVTNGSDHQYVMTMVWPQKHKLGGALATHLEQVLMPFAETGMANVQYEMSSYINVFGKPPDEGWPQFLDWPRYSSGYAALFQTIGVMPEAHMLKPFASRVEATLAFMRVMLAYLDKHGAALRAARERDRAAVRTQEQFPLSWRVDKEKSSLIEFKGYEASWKPSSVTAQQRLHYDRDRPFTKKVPYYDHFVAERFVAKPKAYILSQAWREIAERLELNGVTVERMKTAQTFEVEAYTIESYESAKRPYEGHFPHSKVEVKTRRIAITMRPGDFYIPLDQAQNRYIVEVLEPQGHDSFFAWNYFDTHLQQKEYFSTYVFEDVAAGMLRKDADLRRAFKKRQAEDPEFAASRWQQLEFIYHRSVHHEPEHMRYPVFRVVGDRPG